MIPFLSILGIYCAAGLASTAAQANEPLIDWPYIREIQTTKSTAGLHDVVLDAGVLDKCRRDHGDLRLYNAVGKEVPYAFRIRHKTQTSTAFQATEFNKSAIGEVAEISLDLGQQPAEHNQVKVSATGRNFRRRVDVDGSLDGVNWSNLVTHALIFRFSTATASADERAVPYSTSRFRYLRIRVHADRDVDTRAPGIDGVTVQRTIHDDGEELTFPLMQPVRVPVRENGRAASAYPINLGGRIPLHGLLIEIVGASFSRPYRLDIVDDSSSRLLKLSQGTSGRQEVDATFVRTRFPETFGNELKLTVIDDRNPPLVIRSIAALSAARQLIFDAAQSGEGPWMLYYGNLNASPPNYDFASTISQPLPETPLRVFLGPEKANPKYEPPLSERLPWLIYVVLGLTVLILFWFVRKLAGDLGKQAGSEAMDS